MTDRRNANCRFPDFHRPFCFRNFVATVRFHPTHILLQSIVATPSATVSIAHTPPEEIGAGPPAEDRITTAAIWISCDLLANTEPIAMAP